MPTLWIAVIVVCGLVALVLTASTFAPREHAVSLRARYGRKPAEVWSAITDIDALPTWRTDLKSIERRPGVGGGRPAWIEHTRHGALPLEVDEWDAPRKMVVRIADEGGKLPFGGTWTWHLREVAGGCEVTLSENGFVSNPLFRVLAHFVFGYTRTLDRTLRALGAKFGEETTPKVV